MSSFQDSASTALAFCNAHQFAAYHMKNMHAETQSSHNKDIEAMEQENPENKETFPQKSPLRYSPEEESVTEQVSCVLNSTDGVQKKRQCNKGQLSLKAHFIED